MIKISKNNRWPRPNSTRLRMMHENNPCCIWCGEKTVLYEKYIAYLSDDAATVDHLFVRKDPRRIYCKKHGIPSLLILACHKCNQRRDDMLWERFCRIKKVDINFDFVYC